MGSSVALQLAGDRPDLVRALVCVGTLARYGDKPDLRAYRNGDVAALRDPVPDAIAREFQVSTLANPIDQATLEVMVRESRKVPARVWRAALDGLLEDHFCARIPTIQAPVLLVWGSADSYALRADQDLLRSALPNARLLVYEHVGHALHWEQPQRFANDLADFVATLGATDSRQPTSLFA
jgi:pimeloyl-ACP methyl ester carboxylesterase